MRAISSHRSVLLGPARRATQGNVAIVFGLAMLPLAACAGLAIDFAAAVRMKTRLQAALDSAVLAAASAEAQTSGSGEPVFNALLNEAAQASKITSTVTSSFSIDENGLVAGTADIDLPNSVMRLFNLASTKVTTAAKASYGAAMAEIALVLDNTYSMVGTPLSTLKSAAKDMISTVYAAPGAEQKVRFGIVPFAQYVNVGIANRGAPWLSVAADSSTTTTQCWNTYPNSTRTCSASPATCYSDGVPYACSFYTCSGSLGAPVEQCGPVTNTSTWYGCVGSRSYPLDVGTGGDFSTPVPGIMNVACPAALTRLTNDQSALNAQIDAMVATGETFIGPGLTWGWRVLSPAAPFADGTDTTAHRDVKQYVILMTDGANTYAPDYPTHNSTDTALSNNLTIETCNNIKAKGVTLYVVALGITDAAATNLLNSCASGPPYYYSASTTSQLSDAFASIGKSLTAVHLAQ